MKLGDKNAEIIANLLHLEKYDAINKKALCPWHEEDTPSFIYNPKTLGFHCFRGDTKVITKYGIRKIASLPGQEVEIINGNGEWEKTTFHYCGEQQIYRLSLSSKGKKKDIFTTGEHEWIVQSRKRKIQTKNLRPNQRLQRIWVPMKTGLKPSIDGLRHGFIYGDGHFTRHNQKENIDVFSARVSTEDKLKFCREVFDKILPAPKSDIENLPNCSFGRVAIKSNRNLKILPELTESSEYLFGFLIGLFVTDGNCSDETAIFSSSKKQDIEGIRDICTLIGIPTYPISFQTRDANSNMGIVQLKKPSTIYTLRMVKSAVTPEFYYGNKRMVTPNTYSSYLGYRVVSVEKTDEIAPVYCCETSTHSFALEDFILTGNCFGCSRNTDIIDAYMHTGLTYLEAVEKLFEEAKMTVPLSEKGVKTKRQYHYPKEEPLNDKEHVYAYLKQRGISKETVDMADVREDAHGNIVFNYYDANDVLCLVKYRPSHKIDKSKGEIKCWCQKDADTTPLLFNMNRVNTSQPLLITEGEGDCLAAIESGYTNTVSVPFGANNYSWIEENFDWLEQFDSIIICADNDEAGIKMQKECIFRLGSWRTKFIDIPQYHYDAEKNSKIPMKDLNHVLYYEGKEAVLNLIKNAHEQEVPSVVDVSEVEDIDLDEMDGITTGIKNLDVEIMKLFYGTLTIVSGLPGAGKTSFLSQLMCQSLQQDKPVWMFSRELPCWMQKSWLNYIMAGNHHIKEYSDANDAPFYKVTPTAKDLINKTYSKKWFLYRDDWSNKLEDILSSMEDCVRKYGAKLLILDNLMTIDIGANEDSELTKQTECIAQLIKFAMKYSVAVVLVAHPRKMPRGEDVGIYDISGTSNIINLAHRTIGLRRIDQEKEQSNFNVCLTVIKDRMRGKAGKKINLYYDVPSRRFYTNEKEYNFQYSWDKEQHEQLTYPHREENEVYGDALEE